MNKNERAEEMWKIIKPQVAFWNEVVVLDLGCGYGDMSLYAANAGARHVIAVDKSKEMLATTLIKCDFYVDNGTIILVNYDLNNLDNTPNIPVNNVPLPTVTFCFSVIPYLDNPPSFLRKLAKLDGLHFIEMQYAGDGPGPDDVCDDDDMQDLLEVSGFIFPRKIGSTYIPDRDKERSIWMCGGKSTPSQYTRA